MPRTSDEARSVVVPAEARLPTDSPPPMLGEREATEWAAIVGRLGSAWLGREAHALLIAYCNITVQLSDVHQALAAFPNLPEDPPGWGRYKELTKLRGQLAAQLASLGTKLRLTPQSRYDRHAAGNAARRHAAGRPPPWAEIHDDGMLG